MPYAPEGFISYKLFQCGVIFSNLIWCMSFTEHISRRLLPSADGNLEHVHWIKEILSISPNATYLIGNELGERRRLAAGWADNEVRVKGACRKT